MDFLLEKLFGFSFMVMLIYAVFSVIESISIISKSIKEGFDELEKRAILDGLAYAMLSVFILHIVQAIFISIAGKYGKFVPLVVPGFATYTNGNSNIEAFIFDIALFVISYDLSRYKYEFISQKRFKYTIIAAISLVVLVLSADMRTAINIMK